MRNGLFVVLEGPDGSGKTTQARRAVGALEASGRSVEHLRDPGGTAAGDRIREILLHGGSLDPLAETFLFLAARAQLVGERIRPALRAGRDVVCERFTLSTVVYQGLAHRPRLAPAALRRLRAFVEASSLGVVPDVHLVLDVAPRSGLARKGSHDRIERRGRAFQARVRAGYLAEARRAGAVVIPPGDVETVARRVREAILARR